MPSMTKPVQRGGGGGRPKRPTHNPARMINERDWRRKQREQSIASSRASSVAASPPPPVRPQSLCVNPKCTNPHIVDGTCQSCGAVAAEDANIVAEIQFGESANGQAFAQGVNVAFGEAGPRMTGMGGRRRIAGGGEGPSNLDTILQARAHISAVVTRFNLSTTTGDAAARHFEMLQRLNFLKGRTIRRVAGVTLYWAIRCTGNTPIMLIDIADTLTEDVFVLGRTFKMMINLIYGDQAIGCPFSPMFPEDIIKSLATRLGFYNATVKVEEDAIRIVQRMDRDWIVSGRQINGVCGSALVIAARMNNFRRSDAEIAYVAKTTIGTLQLRLEEFARVESASMSVNDFKEKAFIPAAHDPPAFYRQTKEYQEEQEQKKAARKRKRRQAEDKEGGEGGEGEDGGSGEEREDPNKRQRTDADGFVIPPLPPGKGHKTGKRKATAPEGLTENDIGDIQEAVAISDSRLDSLEDTLVARHGDAPQSAPTKAIRKGRLQGSALREPMLSTADEQWRADEESSHEDILKAMQDSASAAFQAAAELAGVHKADLLEKLVSTRPIDYRNSDLIDHPEVGEDEFADDPEVQNCLLTEVERKIKERLWLNENKQWLLDQQEKEYKAKKAPPKKPRKHNRKPRIGEGQTTPADSPTSAVADAAKRLGVSSKINYDAIGNLANKTRGPGSIASRQTSRAASEVDEEPSDNEEEEEVVEEVVEQDEDEDEEAVDYDEQYANNGDEEEFGGDGGYDDDDY